MGFYENFTTSTHLSNLPGIAFGAINIRSIYSKIDDINVLLHRSCLDYLGITESLLNSSVDNSEIILPGYTLTRLDRNNGLNRNGGGGIVVYTKNKRSFSHMIESENVGPLFTWPM